MAEQEVVGLLRTVLQLDRSDLANGLKLAGADADAFSKKVNAAMRDAERGFSRPEAAVKRLEAAMRGDKLLASANNIVTAMQKVGGATKLTDAEQARYNVTLQKAIEKYRQLGQEAPMAMKMMEAATRRAAAPMAQVGAAIDGLERSTGPAQRGLMGMSGSASLLARNMLGVFGVAGVGFMAVNTLKQMTTAALDSAGRLTDMAAQTGHSTEMLQRMDYVAQQAGATLESMTNASFRLGVAVSGGSSSVRAALSALGLELAKVQAMKPDEMWLAVVDALSKVQDQQERNRLGVALIGRGYANIAASVDGNFREMAASAKVATDQQIAELDRLGDEWAKFKVDASRQYSAFLGDIVANTRATFFGLSKLYEDLQNRLSKARGDEHHLPGKLVGDKFLDPTVGPAASRESAAAMRDYVRELAEAERVVRSLSAAQRNELNAALAIGDEKAEDLEHRFFEGVSGALRVYQSQMRGAGKATKDATKEIDTAARAVQQLRDAWTGATALAEAERIFDAVGGLDGLMKLPIEKQKAYNALVRDVIDLLGDVPERLRAAYAATLPGLAMLPGGAENIANIGSLSRSNPNPFGGPSAPALPFMQMVPGGVEFTNGTTSSLSRLSELTGSITDDMRRLMDIQPPTRQWSDGLEDMARAVDFLTRSIDRFEADGVSAFSNVAQAAATLMGAMSGRDSFGLAGLQMMGASGASMSSRIAGGMNTFGAFMDMASAGNSFEAAVQNAGDSRSARGMAGMRVGAQMGAQFGPYGALAGAGIGFAGGMLDDPGVQGRQRAQMFYREVDALFSSLATSAQEAEASAKTLNARLSGGPVGQWQRGWILVRDAYKETGQTAEQALKDFEAIKEAAEIGPDAVARATAKVNEQLKRYEQLIDVRRQKQDLLNEAVERWGLSWEEAGKGFQMGGLAKQAETFITDWTLLIESGANPDVVSQRMADSVNQFVSMARKAGIEVPEAMRPILETLIDQRLLIDDSGVAFKNLESTGLKFGAALERMFENVLLKLERLIDALTKPIPNFPARTPTGLGEYVGATAVQRRHRGGVVDGAGGGSIFGRTGSGGLFSTRMMPNEVPIVALRGESVLTEQATRRMGGPWAINALNAAADPMAMVTAAASRVTVPIPSAVPYAAVSESNKNFSGRGGDQIHFTISPGAINVSGAHDPRTTAQAVLDAVQAGIHNNRRGFRTKLVQKVRR